MKKYFVIAIIILLISVLFWPRTTKEFIPLSPPDISVTYNQNKIETARGDYNWCDKPDGGSTYLADSPIDLVKNLKTTSVKKGEAIKFNFNTLWKQPNKTTVDLVIPGVGLSEQIENVNFFNAPKEKGEYIFLIFGSWDEGHSVVYVFKINVI